jgi:hypothetical protein
LTAEEHGPRTLRLPFQAAAGLCSKVNAVLGCSAVHAVRLRTNCMAPLEKTSAADKAAAEAVAEAKKQHKERTLAGLNRHAFMGVGCMCINIQVAAPFVTPATTLIVA